MPLVNPANATTIYWDGTGNNTAGWSTAAFWSTSSSATTPNPSAAPGASDIAVFNISTVNTAQIIQLDVGAGVAALGLTFNSTGTVSFSPSNGTRSLALGTSGMTINSGAGAVTFNSKAQINVNGNQSWANNSSSLLTLDLVTNNGNTTPFTVSLTGSGSGGTNFAGVISDGGTTGTIGLNINTTGTGVTTLSGAASNTYTGLTTVTTGELDLAKTGATNAIAGGGLAINGGTVKYTAASTDMIANTANVKIAGGTLDLNNHADTIGSLTFNSGTLTSTGAAQTLTLAGSTGSTLQMQGGATIPSGSTGVNVAFSNTATTGVGMTFDATNNGTATINGNINLNTSAITGVTRTFTINDGTATTDTSITGVISNTTATGLRKAGAGTLALSGANTYTGATTIDGGTVNVAALANGGSNSSIGAAAATASNLIFGGGTLQYTGSTATSTNRLFTIGDANGNSATLDASGSVAAGTMSFIGAGSIAFGNTNAHTLNLTGTNTGANTLASVIGDNTGATSLNKSGAGTWVLGGATSNTYSGLTTVSAGELDLGKSGTANSIAGGGLMINSGTVKYTGTGTDQIANTAAVNVSGGTLDIVGNSDTVGAVTLTSGNINGTTGTLTGSSYGVQSGSISAKLGGTGALTKSNAGTVILTGANSYTGGTNINAGTLALNANNVLPDTGTVTLGGGKLQLNGTQEGTTALAGAGALALTSNSIIDLASTDLIHFLASNGQNWAGNTLSIYNWNGTPITGGGAEQILFGSDTTSLTQGQLDLITFYSDAGTTSLGTAAFATSNNGEIVPQSVAVPEPSTWFAGGLMFATLLFTQRRRLSSRMRSEFTRQVKHA
jgi:autotransporter-associated beta strand protein